MGREWRERPFHTGYRRIDGAHGRAIGVGGKGGGIVPGLEADLSDLDDRIWEARYLYLTYQECRPCRCCCCIHPTSLFSC